MTARSLLVFCALAAFAAPAFSGPITYTYAGIGTGTLGGQAFTGASFVLTAQADTANIAPWANAGGGPQNTHLSLSLEITGLGTFAVTTPSHTWLAQGCCGGIGEDLSLNWITIDEPAFTGIGYGLDTALGPITDNSPGAVYQFHGVGTSGGVLNFDAIRSITFTATTDGTTSVPEPATLPVIGAGILALFLLNARRRT